MSHKVSVIVPVYNAEEFLRRCVDSVLKQTYDNIELILINDGSADKSGVICDTYAEKDCRVRVVHQKNMGVSAARNAGIDLSTGDYLQFVDSDDYVDGNMTDTLVSAIERNSASLVICGYKMIDAANRECIQSNYSEKEGLYSFSEILNIFDDLCLNLVINTTWNKMYQAQIIKENSILFENNLDFGEDLSFNLEVIKKGISFEIISECLYNYIIYNNGNTLTNKKRENKYEIRKMLFEKQLALYENASQYSYQIRNLEFDYSKMLISIDILQIANNYNLKTYKSYHKKAREIRADRVLNKSINYLEFKTPQDLLMNFFIKKEWYFLIYLVAITKQYLKERMPDLFSGLKKWNNG